jgi:hypothetical protein
MCQGSHEHVASTSGRFFQSFELYLVWDFLIGMRRVEIGLANHCDLSIIAEADHLLRGETPLSNSASEIFSRQVIAIAGVAFETVVGPVLNEDFTNRGSATSLGRASRRCRSSSSGCSS